MALAFVLVVGLSTAGVATGSYLYVARSRVAAADERAVSQARFDLALADTILGDEPRVESIETLLRLYERRGSHETTIAFEGEVFASDPRFEATAGDGETVAVGGSPYLVLAGDAGDASLHFYFPRSGLAGNLEQLRNALVIACLVATGIAALTGRYLAMRTLKPVATTSLAARSIAEGVLDTRVPVVSEDEFGILAASFNEMAEAVQSKIEELRAAHDREVRFTANIAHELRTPVAALLTAVSVLAARAEGMDGSIRRPAEMLLADTRRLRDLIEELIEIARFDSGDLEVRNEAFELHRLLDRLSSENGWGSDVQVDVAPVTLYGDPRLVERIIVNLVENGLSHGGGEVSVSAGRTDGEVTVVVADRGPGIAPEHRGKIFDRFYKADPARSDRGNSGLGLAIVAAAAEVCGYRLSVDGGPEDGTRFEVHIPG